MNEQPKKGQEHAAPDPSLNYERPSSHTKDNGSRLPSHTPGSNGNYPVLNILKRTCSVFDGARARTPIATLTVNEIHDAILGLDKRFNVKAKHAEMDELIPGGEAWTRCKESLPAIHSGGVIKTRERGKDREFKGSGFIILDVDGKDNPGKTYEDVYRAFKKCPYIVSLWTSCSGNGWKGVAALTETDDILALEQMRDTLKYLLGEEGITICGATSPSSLEFMSYDPNLVVFDERLIEDVVVDEIALMLSKESETAKLARLERAVGNLSETAFLKKLNECKECLVRAERAGVSIEIHHPEMTHFVWSINDGIARQTGERNAELTEELFEDLFGKWYVGAGVGRGQLHDAASRDHGEGWTWDGIGLAVNNVLDREELTSMKFGLGAVKPEAFQVVGSPEFLEAEAEREAVVAERKEVEEAEKQNQYDKYWDEGGGLTDILNAHVDPNDTLLGDRFLCREGGLLFGGPSGIGKSSSLTQMAVNWALGREAFGIKAAKPLRVLIVQAENDLGDLKEIATGVCDGGGLESHEKEKLQDRVRFISLGFEAGPEFVDGALTHLAKRHRADLVIVDPLINFAGASVFEDGPMVEFFRAIDRMAKRLHLGVVVAHHSPKTNHRDTSEWQVDQWMYSLSGSAVLTNWARAVLIVDPVDFVSGVFRFIAAKRGQRTGWDPGQFERVFLHDKQGGRIHWIEGTPEDALEAEAAIENRKDESKASKLAADVEKTENYIKESGPDGVRVSDIKPRRVEDGVLGFGLNHAARVMDMIEKNTAEFEILTKKYNTKWVRYVG